MDDKQVLANISGLMSMAGMMATWLNEHPDKMDEFVSYIEHDGVPLLTAEQIRNDVTRSIELFYHIAHTAEDQLLIAELGRFN